MLERRRDMRVRMLKSPVYGEFRWQEALFCAVIFGGTLFLGLVLP